MIDAIRQCEETLGPVSLLIANAGMSLNTLVDSFDANGIEKVIDVNLLGAVYATEAVLSGMLERGDGQIVAVAEAYEITVTIEVHGYFTTHPDRMAENIERGLGPSYRPLGVFFAVALGSAMSQACAERGLLVVAGDVTVEEHLVRESAAATGANGDAQCELGGTFGLEQLGHLGSGRVGQRDHSSIPFYGVRRRMPSGRRG